MHRCAACGRTWTEADAAQNEFLCTRKCGGRLDPLATFDDLLPRLPHVLAVPLDEYAREAVAYVRLHRMTDAAELLARFATTVLLSDLLARGGGKFPRDKEGRSKLQEILAETLAAPTFGAWRAIMEEALKAAGRACFVARLPEACGPLLEALGGEKGLIACRNLAAHSGRLDDAEASRLLERHREQMERLFRSFAFLGDTPLAAVSETGEWTRLMGTAVTPMEPPAGAEGARAGRLYLAGDGLLDLSPLHIFGQVRVRKESKFEEAHPTAVPQVYFRADREMAYLEYLTFAAPAPHGQEADDPLARFKELFDLEGWRNELEAREATGEYTFRRLRDRVLAGFVGREWCLEEMTRALREQRDGGIVWMTGKAGAGKSALMAKFLEKGKGAINQADRWVTVYHFFRAQEGPSCSRAAFVRNALAKLLPALGRGEGIEEDPSKAEEQFGRALSELSKAESERPWRPESKQQGARPPFRRGILFFLDGLDELLAADAGFPEFIRRHQHAGVVWFCAGQPLEAFAQARHVFPAKEKWDTADEREGGVPRMTREEVYEYLLAQCGPTAYELMKRDRQGEGGYRNAFVEALVAKSEGLPLYLELVARDVREGRIGFGEGEERRLPAGLRAYYDQLLERMSIGDLKAAMTPLVMRLAVAKGPLTAEALHTFLQNEPLLRGEAGRKQLEDGLRFGHVMLRRAATPGGRLGYTIYHASFREHLLDPAVKSVEGSRRVAREAIEEAAAGWEKHRQNTDALEYCLRFGLAHLLEGGRAEERARLLTDLGFIEAKCAAGMAYELVEDYAGASGQVEEFGRFVRAQANVLGAHPELTPQQAANEPDETALAREARRRLETGVEKRPWIEWVNKPQQRSARLMTLVGHAYHVTACAYSPDGRRIVSGCLDGTLKIWDAESGREIATLAGHSNWVTACAFSPDGRRIVSGSCDGTLKIWDAETGKIAATLARHSDAVGACAYSPDGRRIVSGSGDRTLKVWDAETGKVVVTLARHSGAVRACAYSPDGGRIASAGEDNTLKLWDAESGREVATLAGHSSYVTACAYSPDGRRIVSASWDETLKVWDAESVREVGTLAGHSKRVAACAYSPDGRRTVSASWDQTLKLWDAESGGEVATLQGHSNWVTACAFSPDGRWIVSGSSDNTLGVWDAETGTEEATLAGHSGPVRACAYSPDGRRIVSGSEDKTLKVWDAETRVEVATLAGHSGWVTACAYSPDGRWIVSRGGDKTPKVWDAATGKEVSTAERHLDMVLDCAYSLNGRRIVPAIYRELLRFWDAEMGSAVAEFACSSRMNCLALSPDGSRVFAGDSNGTIYFLRFHGIVWDPPVLTPIRRAGELRVRCPFCNGEAFVDEMGLGKPAEIPCCEKPIVLSPTFCDADAPVPEPLLPTTRPPVPAPRERKGPAPDPYTYKVISAEKGGAFGTLTCPACGIDEATFSGAYGSFSCTCACGWTWNE